MDPSQAKQAMLTSLRILAATPKSRKELEQRLSDKGYHPDVIESTLDQLEGQGALNDRSFAENIKSRLIHAKPSGKRRIDFEMKRRGINAKIRTDILSEIDGQAEHLRAIEAARPRWDRLSAIPREKRRKKIYDFLLRRGFDFSEARSAVQELEKLQNDES